MSSFFLLRIIKAMAITCLGDTYVELIERTECIGNSLAKINSNFAALDIKICEAENTTLSLNSIEGIIKGNGAGEFEIADPDYDYYVPGRTLQTNFNITGSINCGGDITMGGSGKNLSIPQGSISCINVNSTGKGTFNGAIKTFSSLDVGESGVFAGQLTSRTLTVGDAAQINAGLTVGGSATIGGSLAATTFITVPTVNATNALNTSTINATTLNLNQPTSVATITKQLVGISIVDALTASSGIFTGSRVQAVNGIFDNITFSYANVIPSLSTITLTSPLIKGTIINTNILNVNDDGGSAGTIYANAVNANTVSLKSLNVSNIVNGNNVGTITAAVGNIVNIAATDVTGTTVRAVTEFRGPIGNIDTLNAIAGNITTVAATTINATGVINGKKLSITGTGANEGIVEASVSITAPTITATGANGITTPKLTVTGTTNAILLNSASSQIIMDQAACAFNMRGAGSQLNVDGAGSAINAVTVRCTGDVVAFSSSDKRLKKDITKITNALDKVVSLQGVEFTWDEELQTTHQGKDTGVIAQEVEEVMPTAVTTRDNGYKAVKYDRLIPLLIEAVKELRDQNIALQQEINKLKTK